MSGPEDKAGLAPWLGSQLSGLLMRRSHALLISGPSGLGQYDLALALATAWLCQSPSEHGACGQCASCHSVSVRTHPDLCVLMPEVLSLALQWPLDERVQDELDSKKRKPSKDIKVEAAREAVAFTQMPHQGGAGLSGRTHEQHHGQHPAQDPGGAGRTGAVHSGQ